MLRIARRSISVSRTVGIRSVTLPVEIQHLERFKAFQQQDERELERLANLKVKYEKLSTVQIPSQLSSITQYVEDIHTPSWRMMEIAKFQQGIWQWFIDSPSEKKDFRDFGWGTNSPCPSYQAAKRRIMESGRYFSHAQLMGPIMSLLNNEDPHSLCKSHIDSQFEVLTSSLKSSMKILHDEEKSTVPSIATWGWTESHFHLTPSDFHLTPTAVLPTPDICIFFSATNRHTRKFWMDAKDLFLPNIIIRKQTATSMDLEIQNLIPYDLCLPMNDLHFTSTSRNGNRFAYYDRFSIKAEMTSVRSDKKDFRIVYGYIDGVFRRGVCEVVVPIPPCLATARL